MADAARPPAASTNLDSSSRALRGIHHLGHPMVFGGLIGVIGGAAFMLGGAAALPDPAQATARGTALGLAVLALLVILLRRRVLPSFPSPTRGAMRTYWIAVTAMAALFPVTHLEAQALHAPTAQIALIAAVVGGHFLPFASAFRAPVFWWIGGAMAAFGLLGAGFAAAEFPAGGPAGAIAAGAAMLLIVTV